MKEQDFSSDKNLVSSEDTIYFYSSLVKISRLSVSASRKSASQHLTISVYVINRILHAYMWIQILSSRVQLNISLVRCTHS